LNSEVPYFIFIGLAQDVLLKQLVPSILAGVILGKGGETITGLQMSTGTVMKMSKGNDYYPGNDFT
jgi:RNA-binding protein Nova